MAFYRVTIALYQVTMALYRVTIALQSIDIFRLVRAGGLCLCSRDFNRRASLLV
jgi:hypothetical protein